MTIAVVYKLLAIFATVGLGWAVARWGAFGASAGPGASGASSAPAQDSAPVGLAAATQALSQAAFGIFVPALLFRTMARLDFATLPGTTLLAYFVPALLFTLAVYAAYRRRVPADDPAAAATLSAAAVYGNAVQLGIPMSAALFGEAGLALHIALVSVHGLVLLSTLTVLAEIDIARAHRASTLAGTVRTALRNAVLHPVTLPVLLGMACNLAGLRLHPALDEALAMLATAVVPVCLVLIGMNLAQYGLRGRLQAASSISALKLLLLPALVLAVGRLGFGLTGTALAVIVMMAALPVGSNALIFAQRYDTRQAQATASIVVSTLAFAGTASLWLGLLAWLGAA